MAQPSPLPQALGLTQPGRRTGRGFSGAFLNLAFCGLAFLSLSVSHAAYALDFLSTTAPAILFDAPSAKAKPLFVMRTGTPVERVVNVEGWVKVRDAEGTLAWVEKKYLGNHRQLIVTSDLAQVRVSASDQAPVVFEAARNVVIELLQSANAGTSLNTNTVSSASTPADSQTASKSGGATTLQMPNQSGAPPTAWLKVKHRDGAQGFIKTNQVWGW